MGTPITVWESLQLQGTAVAGAIIYIDPVTLQPSVDDAGLHYEQDTDELGVKKIAYTLGIAGASGNIVLNAGAGVVQFAAAAQELTLTNSDIEADSWVHCTVQTDDATAKSAVAHSILLGSCKIKLNAAATGITKVLFTVVRAR